MDKHHTPAEAIRAAQDEAWRNGHTLDPFRARNGIHRAYCVDCSAAAAVGPDENDERAFIRTGRALSARCTPLF